ncbi:probable protein S-acyltransferase 22 isoform X2 [Magnolia sinica]|uniref:probable protein S-acyltransferase 22 isoform X2 n=1 Tax=Magnolia sinica TaxID=86752 RepID=UPI002659DC15|nr:probable protein S-acyltransferase 22 isoform X2 [Magnolia sinica]
MRKHGWQPPYHPLQVVAVAVFLALGFAFYVFFLPFVGRKLFQYVVLGLYTPLVTFVFCLYIWSAATDPGDPGVFKSKKYLSIMGDGKYVHPKASKLSAESTSSVKDVNAAIIGEKPLDEGVGVDATRGEGNPVNAFEKENTSSHNFSFCSVLFGCCPFAFTINNPCSREQSSEQRMSEDGMFYCSLCEVEGISTYDYIIALRDQEQQATGVQQSPQMSPASSLTGLSSASSFNTFHRGAWCTPPRLFLEDQFDVVPPGASTSMNSSGKRTIVDMPTRKRNTETVKISPWTLAHLNSEEVSKVAAQARKKSRVHHPVLRQEAPLGLETDSSFGSSSQMLQRPDNRRRANKRGSRLLTGLPLEPLAKMSAKRTVNSTSDLAVETSSMGLAPLQLEARSAFRTSLAMSSAGGVASSPDSSLDSPDLHPFHVSVKAQGTLPPIGTQVGIQLSRSTSDGYEASGGEDSDRVPSRMLNNRQSSLNWSSLLLFSSGHVPRDAKSKASSSSMDGRPIRH